MSRTHVDIDIRQLSIAGGAAGDHEVDGITTRDALKSVVYVSFDDSLEVETLTDEFSISEDGIINNTGGTVTTGGFLIILYISAGPYGGDLNRN